MAETPGSPQWWLKRLERDLAIRAKTIARWNAYYEGDHELAFATERFKAAFGGQFRELADNWMALVVDSVEERLNVEGFRFGTDTADGDAWYMWQANNLDGESGLGHLEALATGTAYVLVDPTGESGTLAAKAVPLVTVEDPTQVIHATDPANRRVRPAALKRWRDDIDNRDLAVLYLPDTVFHLERKRGKWDTLEEVPNPLGVVPVVPLENRTRLLGEGVAEHRNVIPLQDAVNKLLADMIIASEFAAFFQRWATGIDIPEDPVTGKAVAPFDVGLDKLLVDSDPDARFGAFPASDLSNYVKAIELGIQHIASQSRTPPHYLLGSMGTWPSGESLRATETGLVAKVRRRMRSFEDSWEEVVRLCFKARGDSRADIVDAETVWRDPESRTESEHIDALSKLQALQVPVAQLWEDAGYSPQQIARFRTMSAEDLLQQAITATTQTEATTPDMTPTQATQTEALTTPVAEQPPAP